jgi:hypothetical protein
MLRIAALLIASCHGLGCSPGIGGRSMPAPTEAPSPPVSNTASDAGVTSSRAEALQPAPAPAAPVVESPSAQTAPSSPPASTERRPTAAETRECSASGGTIQPVCMMGELMCVVRYRDAGKRCSDKRDCIAECLYEGPDPPPPKATGRCQRTNDPCGCKAPIHHGHVEPALCAD